MADWAAIITAAATGLTTVGGGAAFVWNKVERRFKEIDRELEKCREREEGSQERRGVLITVIELLWFEIERKDKGSPALVRSKRLLDDLKEDHVTRRFEAQAEELGRLHDKDHGRGH